MTPTKENLVEALTNPDQAILDEHKLTKEQFSTHITDGEQIEYRAWRNGGGQMNLRNLAQLGKSFGRSSDIFKVRLLEAAVAILVEKGILDKDTADEAIRIQDQQKVRVEVDGKIVEKNIYNSWCCLKFWAPSTGGTNPKTTEAIANNTKAIERLEGGMNQILALLQAQNQPATKTIPAP
jgi:hypothetical protein